VATVDDIRRLVALDHGLASLSTLRADGGVHATLVNAGVIDHPVDGEPVAAFVARPSTRKLANLLARPTATLHWRAGWAWVAAEGTVEVAGPDQVLGGFDTTDLPELLRTIYAAAGGGDHADWADYDRVMATERRVAVLLRPRRIYVNP
jgi:PPOX class probable F420-dependent enzyme